MSELHLGDALHAYLDNELSAERALEARAHLVSCSSCRQEFEQLQLLREAVRSKLKPPEPSAAFLRKLRYTVRRADPARWQTRLARAALFAGPAAAAALVVLLLLPSVRRPGEGDLTAEVVSAHVRSLQASHLLDIASSDRHAVKPWFQGKVPFSLPVRDFREQGFALEGGRLDYLNGQTVAALVYRVREHAINAFVWPAPAKEDSGPKREARQGLHLLHWVSDGMAWWLVSDVNDGELERLSSLLREYER